jgi:hypothetical protein
MTFRDGRPSHGRSTPASAVAGLRSCWTAIAEPHIVDPLGLGFISMFYFLVGVAVALVLLVVVVAGVIAKLREMDPNWR